MGDEHDAAGEGAHTAFQPVDRGEVQVVGRLVQQQQLRVADQRAREADAATPATGQLAEALVLRQFEFAADGVDALVDAPAVQRVDALLQLLQLAQTGAFGTGIGKLLEFVDHVLQAGQAGGHVFANRLVQFRRQRLLQLAYPQRVAVLDFAVVGLLHAGDQPQQRGLAGPVPADQANALARLDSQARIPQDHAVAEIQGDFVEAQQTHGRILRTVRPEKRPVAACRTAGYRCRIRLQPGSRTATLCA